jgi:hypothetical protein
MKEYKVKFRTPDTSWTAIVQGAVVCGIDNVHISSIRRAKSCEYSYGVGMDEIFQETYHAREDLVHERDGESYAQAQLIWLINEGDAIFSHEPHVITKEFDVISSWAEDYIDLPIYRYSGKYDGDEADRPERLKNALEGMISHFLPEIKASAKISQKCLKPLYLGSTSTIFAASYLANFVKSMADGSRCSQVSGSCQDHGTVLPSSWCWNRVGNLWKHRSGGNGKSWLGSPYEGSSYSPRA